ncbi:MAG: DUF2029 domain-containing protein [Candidatus Eisenbacteria bacterium]|nr:DUF2029 domain-containing protein [Candidatus Eisenbacteria bacterium]MCC7142683.1 DUF2029 domain-containing protein [Candidatus Eisenbacteria bacterium]
MSRGALWARIALGLAVLLHLLFVVNLRTQELTPLFVEITYSPGQAADFFGIYGAGDQILHGRSIYTSWDYAGRATDPVFEMRVPYYYFYRYLPPTAYVAGIVAALLSPWPAYWLWIVINEILMIGFVWSLRSLRDHSETVRLLLAAIALASFPFALEQWMGQFSFTMAILLWIATFPALRGVDRAETGLATCVRRGDFWGWMTAVGLKNFPALIGLTHLVQRRWRRVLWCAVGVIVASAPYYLLRPEDLRQFALLNFRPLPPELLAGSYGMLSLVRGLTAALLGDLANQRLVLGPIDTWFMSLPIVGWSALVLGTSAWVTWRAGRGQSTDAGICLWTLAFFLVFKDIWEYHYVMLLPVVFALALRGPARAPLVLGALLSLPTPFALYDPAIALAKPATWPAPMLLLHYGSKALPTLGLYLLTVRRLLGRD